MNDKFIGFSSRLKSLIKERNITQIELSNAIGISKYALNNYAVGNRLPETTILYALSQYFNKSMEWFLTGEDNFTIVRSYDCSQKNEVVFDPDTRDMIEAVKLMMSDPDPDVRAWAKVQFRRTFPEYFGKAVVAADEKKQHA